MRSPSIAMLPARAPRAKWTKYRTYPINRFGGLRPLLRWRKARAVAARISKGSVRAIVTDTWKSLELLLPRSLAHTRVFCLAHGSEFLARPGSIKERRMIACLAKADIIAANSHFTANLAKPFIGGKTELRVIPPGVEPLTGATRTFTPRAAKGGGRILTIARLEPRKGIDMVLQAIPALQRTHPDIVYDIIGKGADKARLAALAEKLGIANRVHFYGHIAEAEKAALLAAANVFALPNRREPGSVEGFGIVFLRPRRSACRHLPAQMAAQPTPCWMDQTGLLVDGADGAAVQSALLKLPDNSGTAIRLGVPRISAFGQISPGMPRSSVSRRRYLIKCRYEHRVTHGPFGDCAWRHGRTQLFAGSHHQRDG